MRATSTRRAPQRRIIDRTLGETTPLADGACPTCHRVVALTKNGRRRAHRDDTGNHCTGSGILVGLRPVELDELPPVNVPPRPTKTMVGPAWHRAVLASDGYGVPYTGRSDRVPAHGRGECDRCGRHLPLNSDGTIRRHRVRHQDPTAPYCGDAS